MNKYIFILLLASTNLLANDFEGHLQAHKYVNSNKSGYTDNLKEPATFGLDLELRHKLYFEFLKLMVGFDSDTTNKGFSRAAGRAGINLELLSFDVGFYHRSNHNFDYVPKQPMRVISENYVFIKYNFGGDGR